MNILNGELDFTIDIMNGSENAIVCLPGTFISPLVYNRPQVSSSLDKLYISWMTSKGPWDIWSLGKRVSALARSLNYQKLFLAGHSTGGAIALAAVIQNPEVFSGIVLSNTGANMKNQHGDVEVVLDAIENKWSTDIPIQVLRRSFFFQPDEEILNILHSYVSGVTKDCALEVLRSQYDTDLTSYLGEIDIPVILAHGRYDTVRPIAHAELLQSELGNSELMLLEAGHTPMVEDPGGYGKPLRDYWREPIYFLTRGIKLFRSINRRICSGGQSNKAVPPDTYTAMFVKSLYECKS